MHRRHQPQLPPPGSRTRHAQDDRGHQKPYIESPSEEDEDWRDSPSEIPHRRHQAPRKEPGIRSPNETPVKDPGNAGYMRQAGGETVPYSPGPHDSNPFAPTYQPGAPSAWTQNAYAPFPTNQPITTSYPAGLNSYLSSPYSTYKPYADPYNAGYYSQPPPYQYATDTQPPVRYSAPGYYDYGGNFYSDPQPTAHYPTGPSSRVVPEPSHPDYEPERARRAPNNGRTDRQSRKTHPSSGKGDKDEADRREARKRDKEAANRREARQRDKEAAGRRDFNKLQKRLDELECELSQWRDVDARPDPGSSRLEYLLRSPSVLGRLIPDDLRSWGERRGDSDQILEEIGRLIEESRRHGDRGSYASSRKESLEAPSRERLELERRASLEPRDDREFRSRVEAVVMDILAALKLDEPGDNGSPRRPAIDEDAIREGRRRSRGLRPVASNDTPIEPVMPAPGRRSSLRHSRVQNLPGESSRTTTKQRQDDPTCWSKTRQTLRQARPQRNNTKEIDTEEDFEPSEQVSREAGGPRVPPTGSRRAQAAWATENRDNVGRRREQPTVDRERDDFEMTQGMPVDTGKQRRDPNLRADVRQEDDPESDEPREPYPTPRQPFTNCAKAMQT